MNLNIIKLGMVPYKEALQLQEILQSLRKKDKINDTLLLLEHSPVITLGRRGKYSNIKVSESFLKKENIEVFEVGRGGDVTYHGPGQLVGYIFFDLRNQGSNIKKFIWNIEEVFIRLLKEYKIESYRDDNIYTGVWIGNSKITAIGIYISRWITMHGFSFNINTDLSHYDWINPCGILNREVTSLEKILGEKQDFKKIIDKVIYYFLEIFEFKPVYFDAKDYFVVKDYFVAIARGENVYCKA